jgi:four helix bundle protein
VAGRPLTPDELQRRLTQFAINVCLTLRNHPRDAISDCVIPQLLKACTSVGANYSEARDAESRRDFIHKVKVCVKEARETLFWLQIKAATMPTPGKDEEVLVECDEIIAILVRSVKTARG